MSGTPHYRSTDLSAGQLLGRYEILLPVAQGGMARVWAAKQHGQRGFSKVVAIKTILPNLAEDETFEQMFLDEARVASGVHHPNVCEIFDLGEENGVLYLAMEWVEGESLARVLKPGSGVEGALPQRIEPRLGAKIIAEACGGLHAAHELTDDNGYQLNVVHRDVSPQNILIGSNGTVKVTDFGVAKALGMSSETTNAGQIKGKAPYMSPEQAGGAAVDRRSDIFALGICLYEATTGKKPFSAPGGNQVQIVRQVLSGQFHPPSAHVPDYPRELEQIVLKAMSMDPFQRFATADRMKTALEEWLARSGPVITQTQIGAEVQSRVGHIINQRQEYIKQQMRQSSARQSGEQQLTQTGFTAAAAEHPASAPSYISHIPSSNQAMVSSAPSSGVAPSPKARGTLNNAMLGVGIGLGAFLLIGGVGLGAVHFLGNKGDAQAPIAGSEPALIAPITSATEIPEENSPSLEAPVAEPERAVQAEPIELEFDTELGVRLELNGAELKPEVRSLTKPEGDEEQQLIARAPGYNELRITLNSSTQSPLKLELVKSQAEEAPSGGASLPRPGAGQRGPSAKIPEEKPAKKPAAVDIPDNPFD